MAAGASSRQAEVKLAAERYAALCADALVTVGPLLRAHEVHRAKRLAACRENFGLAASLLTLQRSLERQGSLGQVARIALGNPATLQLMSELLQCTDVAHLRSTARCCCELMALPEDPLERHASTPNMTDYVKIAQALIARAPHDKPLFLEELLDYASDLDAFPDGVSVDQLLQAMRSNFEMFRENASRSLFVVCPGPCCGAWRSVNLLGHRHFNDQVGLQHLF
ncbi:unnamed protein product [Polarella glacialis]|uniref:Uncharacterized protein n=1 Tax=Polarella glacialis TaxID=89957 RepID=A0A813JQI9_POLGL|nr:unnamed protein product [Polarella glacialis]